VTHPLRAGRQPGGVDRPIRDSVDEGAGSAYAMKITGQSWPPIALATPIPAMPHATPSGGPTAQIGPICGPPSDCHRSHSRCITIPRCAARAGGWLRFAPAQVGGGQAPHSSALDARLSVRGSRRSPAPSSRLHFAPFPVWIVLGMIVKGRPVLVGLVEHYTTPGSRLGLPCVESPRTGLTGLGHLGVTSAGTPATPFASRA